MKQSWPVHPAASFLVIAIATGTSPLVALAEPTPIESAISEGVRDTDDTSTLPPATTEEAAGPDWWCDSVTPEVTYPTVKLGGFFQADIGWFHQDAASNLAVGDVQDGADFRRARLSGSGNVANPGQS